MLRRLQPLLGCLLAAAVTGCGNDTRPAPAAQAPPAATQAPDAGLQPLTSRDATGAANAPAASPVVPPDLNPQAAPGSLPSGHPPIDQLAPGASTAPAGGSVSGTVDVASAHKGKVTGGALFLIARNAQRQIVAVRRAEDVTLPQKFQLSGADAMTVGTTFEGPLDITARWSQRGDAMPAPGDIEGTVRGVKVGATDLKLVLSDVRQ